MYSIYSFIQLCVVTGGDSKITSALSFCVVEREKMMMSAPLSVFYLFCGCSGWLESHWLSAKLYVTSTNCPPLADGRSSPTCCNTLTTYMTHSPLHSQGHNLTSGHKSWVNQSEVQLKSIWMRHNMLQVSSPLTSGAAQVEVGDGQMLQSSGDMSKVALWQRSGVLLRALTVLLSIVKLQKSWQLLLRLWAEGISLWTGFTVLILELNLICNHTTMIDCTQRRGAMASVVI